MPRKNNKARLIALLICLPLSSICQDNAILKIGHKLTIHSKILNETRDAWIYLPPNYYDKYFQAGQYPVLYILDGDTHFHSVSGMIQILGSGMNGGTFVIPEMIVVAIPNTDRIRDLTPTHTTRGFDGKEWEGLQSTGGMDNFLKFMKDELIPKVDSSYRTFPYRVFAGQSFGGIAVINALFTMPQTFNAYISIDPSLWWDNQVLLQQARQYFNHANLKGKSLFLAQANSLYVEDTVNVHFEAIKELATILETRNHSGLKWNYRYYPNDNHSSVALAAEYDAFRFIFEKYYADPSVIVTFKQLQEQYQQFSDEAGINFSPPERVVHFFGANARYRKKYDLAQEFFQRNIENYPKSSSALANMGELWDMRGDKKKALEYYEKSLKVFPGNEGSKYFAERLRKELQLKK